ncbi:acetoacetate--CoA ligase [Streptomyces sp. NBC_00841]|uniref:acetoacetate--CoA ligase n=1 Tax=unclassified Streptomyces TaxID=2593676 RepID=UPI002251A4C5|nr:MULTISPECIES: acetoacetate--CoA ligase [unclassified Streptomyces]MCX4530211.1 acetoacetate--CoA ligase [Streptomyces sp. NBC_01669]WSA04010.1 acetoacetate--CoA ligase [Streptomyces sp. NBC_00841]
MNTDTDLLWSPSRSTAESSNVAAFMRWLSTTRGLSFSDYTELWRWSTTDVPAFWSAVWEFYGLDAVSSYDEVLADPSMPGASWFPGARLNFAEQCFAHATDERPALITVAEGGAPAETSWQQLRSQVATVAASLRDMGVGPGDHVAGYLPNTAHAVIALLASAAVGAVWTVCSPDFGTPSVLARLQQAQPSVLVAADGYYYGGKEFDRRPELAEIMDGLPTVRHLIAVDYLYASSTTSAWSQRTEVAQHTWSVLLRNQAELSFADVPSDHPLWILWSSGTTGVPKGIVQAHGGIVVELLKALGLGADLRSEDRYFFHTSTSWMVWNFMVGGLLHGATIILYDGSPTYPDVNGVWKVAEQTRATMVGMGAAYLVAAEKADAHPAAEIDLSAVRSILQTGSALPGSTWRWVYDRLASDVWLQSICGGTDICSVLAGGSPLLPVRLGRIQCPALGVALAAWDFSGQPLVGEQGELVVTAPLPSMPLHFVNDPENQRYLASYFDVYPGIWRHGDWVTVDPDLSVVVAGRSDSTLNRMGVRMGSADIYAVVERLPQIADSVVIGAELPDGQYFMPLFVVLAEGAILDDALRNSIAVSIKGELSPRHVPDAIVPIAAVPRTLTGKKLEVPVKRIMQGARAADVSAEGAITHPEMLAWFEDFATRLPAGR